jgi:hypothetical protein
MKELKEFLPLMVLIAYIGAMVVSMFVDVAGNKTDLILGLILIMIYAKE